VKATQLSDGAGDVALHGLFNDRLAAGMQILGFFTVLGIGFTTLAIAQKA
jgi:hypothetical protein